MKIQNLELAMGIDISIIVPIVLIVYMAAMLLIGLWSAKKVKNSEDWFVGGRSMGPWITALAHGSSSLGGGMYIAGPQFGWEAGASALWAAPGDVFGPLLNFGILARRMRRYTEKAKTLTISEFFGHRYYSKGVRNFSVFILIIAMLISLVVEYMAMGVLVSAVTGWSFIVSLIVGCAVILIYTGAVFGFLLAFGVYTLGCVGRVVYPDISMLPGGNAEYVLPMLALTKLPSFFAGLLLAGACSAVMSTASGLLLVIGSVMGNDLYRNSSAGKSASDVQVMKVTKMSTYVLGILSIAMCFIPIFQLGVYQLTWIAWSVLSPAFIPCIVGGLYWKRGTKEGAYAAMISGSLVGAFWYYLLQEATNIHTFFAALVIAIAAYIVVSLRTQKPPKEIEDYISYAAAYEDADQKNPVKSGIVMSCEQLAMVLSGM